MPDPSKFEKLSAVGFKLRRSCRTCLHADGFGNRAFGRCLVHEYDHGKHTEPKNIPAHVDGICDSFEPETSDAAEYMSLARFAEDR